MEESIKIIRGRRHKNITRHRMNFSKLTWIVLKLKSNGQAKQLTNAARDTVSEVDGGERQRAAPEMRDDKCHRKVRRRGWN